MRIPGISGELIHNKSERALDIALIGGATAGAVAVSVNVWAAVVVASLAYYLALVVMPAAEKIALDYIQTVDDSHVEDWEGGS